jgi:hypothetical protein
MAIKTHTIKSCCGNSSTILETDKPLRKYQVDVFKQAGYVIPDNFFNSGVFYAQKDGLIATGSFGTNKISLRVSPRSQDLIQEFSQLLEAAVSK